MRSLTRIGRILLLAAQLLLTTLVFAGERTSVAPDPATGLTAGTRTTTTIHLSWTPGTGSRRIVVLRPATGASTIAPAAGTEYAVASSGSYTGPGNATTGMANVVVYNGTGNSVTVTGLGVGAAYVAIVYEYNGAAGSAEYSAGLSSGTMSTLAAEPAGQVPAAGLSFGGVQGSSSVKLDYTSATAAAIGANGYLLLYKEGAGATLSAGDLPADGTAYATGNSIGAATVGAFINSGSQSSSTVTGLTGTRHYTFFLVPYAGSATNTTYNYNTGGTIASRYVPSFAGSVSSAGGEAAGISSLVNTSSITDATQGVQVWQFTISEGIDDDALPTIIRSLTINTPAANQFSFSPGIQSAALFLGSTPVAATLTIPGGSDQLQFANISNVTVPDNGSLTLSLRLSVKANVNNGASTGSGNKDGARFVFQISNANVTADVAANSSQLSAFPAITSQASGVNTYNVVGTAMQFAQAPPATTDPYVALSPVVAVEVVDAGGNRDVDYAATVSLASSLGIDGFISATPAAGLATFTGLYFTGSGNGTLVATSSSYSISSPVSVSDVGILGGYTFNAAANCGGRAYAPSAVADHLGFGNIALTGISCNGNGITAGTTTTYSVLSTNTTWPASADGTKYIEFQVSAAANYGLNASAIAFETLRTAAGATNVTLRSSVDGFSTDLGTATVNTTLTPTVLALGAAFSNVTGTITFRLYPWGGTSGNFRIDNLMLRGNVVFSQVVADYRTVQSGAYDDAATWEYYTGSGWSAATLAPGAANKRTVQSGHILSLTSGISTDPGIALQVDGILDAGTGVITGGGTVIVNGGLRTAHPSGMAGTLPVATVLIGSSGTIYYTGSGQAITARPYVNLDLSAAASASFPAGTIGISGSLLTGAYTSIPNSTIEFDGSAPQVVPGIGYAGLRINNAAGVQLAGAASTGSLILASGMLTLGAHTLSADAISGGSATSFVVTNGSGALIRIGLNGTQLLPVGADAATYTPVTVTHSDGIDWAVRVQAGFSGYPAMNSAQALPRVWHLLPAQSPTASPATVTFAYPDALWSTPATVNAYHYSNGWYIADNGAGLSPVLAGGLRTVTLSGQTQFSPFAIAGTATPLPVHLLYFHGRTADAGGILEWATATESNNAGFTVERSPDGRRFEAIASLPSAAPGGNSTHRLEYRYTDAALSAGGAWYRLRQTDLDGRHSYSTVLRLQLPGVGQAVVTQAGSRLRLRLHTPARTVVAVALYAADGRLIYSKNVAAAAGTGWYDLPAPPVAGTYFLHPGLPGNMAPVRFIFR